MAIIRCRSCLAFCHVVRNNIPKIRDKDRRYLHLLLFLLRLEILVGEVGGGTTDEYNGIHANAKAGSIAGRCGGGDGAGLGRLGGWVAGLFGVSVCQLLASRGDDR